MQGWGKAVVEILSKELQKEFPGDNGYSTRNLWRMHQFYIEYTQNTILPQMEAEIDNSRTDAIEREYKVYISTILMFRVNH